VHKKLSFPQNRFKIKQKFTAFSQSNVENLLMDIFGKFEENFSSLNQILQFLKMIFCRFK